MYQGNGGLALVALALLAMLGCGITMFRASAIERERARAHIAAGMFHQILMMHRVAIWFASKFMLIDALYTIYSSALYLTDTQSLFKENTPKPNEPFNPKWYYFFFFLLKDQSDTLMNNSRYQVLLPILSWLVCFICSTSYYALTIHCFLSWDKDFLNLFILCFCIN